MPNLTDKQEMFCREYLIDFNATEAAIRAGYSKKTARSIGSENLSKPDIQERLNALKKDVQDRNDVLIDELIGDLRRIKDFDPIQFFNEDGSLKPVTELSEDARQCLASLDITSMESIETQITTKSSKFKHYDKLAAIEKLMRYVGAYKEDNDQKAQAVVQIIKLPDNGRS